MMSLLKAAFCAAEPSQRHRRRRWRLLTWITRTAGLCRSTNALTAARGVPYGSSRCLVRVRAGAGVRGRVRGRGRDRGRVRVARGAGARRRVLRPRRPPPR